MHACLSHLPRLLLTPRRVLSTSAHGSSLSGTSLSRKFFFSSLRSCLANALCCSRSRPRLKTGRFFSSKTDEEEEEEFE